MQAGKDLTYLFVIIGGFVVLAFLMYMVGSEFFTSDSPSSIFTKTLKRVKSDEKVQKSYLPLPTGTFAVPRNCAPCLIIAKYNVCVCVCPKFVR